MRPRARPRFDPRPADWLRVMAGIVLGALAPLQRAQAAAIENLALEASGEATRLLVDLDGPARAALFSLSRPDRVVIDLKPATVDRRRVGLPAAGGVVRHVRVGPRAGGVLRIVLELDRPVRARSLAAAGSVRHRVTVDLAPLGSAPRATPATTPAAAPAQLAAAYAPLPAPRNLVIAVDAGHGGVDPGATGRGGTREKDVTLAVARVLAARINAEPGMRAVLTRAGDYFVPLGERSRQARAAEADLFVSVHADAVTDRSVTGSSVYVLSQRGASSEAAKWLADRENAADLVGGVSLDDKDNVLASVLLDLSQSAAMSASSVAAAKVLEELNQVGEVRKAQVQHAGFVVLKSPDVPSMLIESAYITNPGEERRLKDPQHQARLAEAILAGIRSYFRENPPAGSRLALVASSDGGAAPGGSSGRVLRH